MSKEGACTSLTIVKKATKAKVRPLSWMHRFAARRKFQKLYFIETYAIYRRSITPLFTVFLF